MLQAGRRGGGVERWKNACWLWRAPKIMGARPHSERAPKNNGGAPSNNGGAPSFCGRFGDSLLFFMQLRVDDF